jgi:thiamine monophosphate synthase|tara:strand:+ start:5308 stop:5862 length:555 start_codon:yes stop_codon:yes gene_type:complete
MFIIKDYYYLYTENSESIDFDTLKKNKKISIIYRNHGKQEELFKIKKLRNECNLKNFKLYIANNQKLATDCHADGLYVSSYNKKIYFNKNLIGSAHNYQEIYEKQKQGCKTIILSRLFKTNYENKKSYYGTTKFNMISKFSNLNIIPLGGINSSNLLKLNLVLSSGLALLSEVKKKPVITNRLF